MPQASDIHPRKPSLFARFRREDGAVTVEAVFWVPFFVALLMLLADAALIFYGQARALSVAQEANRALSVGNFATYADTESFIETALAGMSPGVTASVGSNDGIITTVVTLPADELAVIGFFTWATDFDMQVVAQMVKEI
jgi:Flp pilus assembly protein TadG